MSTKKKNYGVLRLMSFFLGFAAVLTLIPMASVNDVSILGYKSVCPFSPVSTIVLLFAGLTVYRYQKRAVS